jgi:RNA polymerase sigma factor (sigma-70 family)
MPYQYRFAGPGLVASANRRFFDLGSASSGRRRLRKRGGLSQTKHVVRIILGVRPRGEFGGSIMNEAESQMAKVSRLAAAAAAAREQGDEGAAEEHFRAAFELAMDAAKSAFASGSHPTRVEVLRTATRLALENGNIAQARRVMDEAFALDPSAQDENEWAQLQDMDSWPDAWLIAAVRRDPPDTEALDRLASRHWKGLFARCRLLTLNFDKANDLGQEAWCRVLRARHTLKPGGNLPAYLATVATNLWRDRHRSARRAGPLSEERLLALDAALPDTDGQTVALKDVLPDLNALQTQQQALLALDIDKALEQLSPQLRDVLVARYIIGESSAEIGRRYGRTEQTISSWVRAAVREIKVYFEEQHSAAEEKEAQ